MRMTLAEYVALEKFPKAKSIELTEFNLLDLLKLLNKHTRLFNPGIRIVIEFKKIYRKTDKYITENDIKNRELCIQLLARNYYNYGIKEIAVHRSSLRNVNNLARISTLEILRLVENKISINSITAIAKSNSIKALTLASNNLQDVAALILAKNNNLIDLNLYNNRFTEIGLNAIRSMKNYSSKSFAL